MSRRQPATPCRVGPPRPPSRAGFPEDLLPSGTDVRPLQAVLGHAMDEAGCVSKSRNTFLPRIEFRAAGQQFDAKTVDARMREFRKVRRSYLIRALWGAPSRLIESNPARSAVRAASDMPRLWGLLSSATTLTLTHPLCPDITGIARGLFGGLRYQLWGV